MNKIIEVEAAGDTYYHQLARYGEPDMITVITYDEIIYPEKPDTHKEFFGMGEEKACLSLILP